MKIPSFDEVVPLCRLAMAIADPRSHSPRDALIRIAREGRPPDTLVREAILQTIPYSGIPGAVEALGLWLEVSGGRLAPPPTTTPTMPRSNEEWRVIGEEHFATIYGDLASRVRDELRGRHPLLEEWILEFAYGRVMGRGALPIAEIEALGVASLLAQGRRAPLHSHLRGMLRTGWSKEASARLLDSLAPDCPREIVDFARQILAREPA